VGDEVVIWVNKIGPFNNPQETYTYNSLPFCKPSNMEEPEAHALGVGEILEGNELFNSGQAARFTVNTPRSVLCSQTLTETDAATFSFSVDQHYWYQMSVDDLPVWGLVGKIMTPEDDPELLKKVYSVLYDNLKEKICLFNVLYL
jgi:transmembrane 9 superfamily protein 3